MCAEQTTYDFICFDQSLLDLREVVKGSAGTCLYPKHELVSQHPKNTTVFYRISTQTQLFRPHPPTPCTESTVCHRNSPNVGSWYLGEFSPRGKNDPARSQLRHVGVGFGSSTSLHANWATSRSRVFQTPQPPSGGSSRLRTTKCSMRQMAIPGGERVENERCFAFWPAPHLGTLGGQQLLSGVVQLKSTQNSPEA